MDELTPNWLNNAFLSDCLQNESKNKNLIVTDFKVESAVPPGNNYGSIVVRVKLNYRDKASTQTDLMTKVLIIKLPLTQGTIKEIFDNIDVEPIFYKDYLSKAYQLKNDFAPKYYPSSSTKVVVVLEDLKEAGFVMADLKEKLNLDNCLHYAEAAAAFHGGSFGVFEKHPELIKLMCSEKIFSNKLKAATSTKNMIRYGLDCTSDHILKLTGDKRISRIIKDCSEVLWDLLVKVVKPTGEFDTMNQGDPWLTNMMFRHDDKGNCVGMKLLDFQAMRYASPATDLVFFLWTSAKHYVREEHYDQFIQTYLEAMNRNLEEMNSDKRLSLEFLKEELLRASPIALYAISTCLPIYEVRGGADVEGLFRQCEQEYSPEKNPMEVLFTEDFCSNHLVRLVNQMEKLGAFEYLIERCCVQYFIKVVTNNDNI